MASFLVIAFGPVLAALVAWGAKRAHALDRDGALAAFCVGSFTYLGAISGWTVFALAPVLAVLFAFFIPSVALSRVGRARKRALADIPQKSARDARQVLANGGIATLCLVAGGLFFRGSPSPIADALLWAFAGAYAAATADTWATEIGSAFGGIPRSIVTFRPVAPGLSGAVTILGSAATLAGAAWIGLVWAIPQGSASAFAIVTVAGACGSLADSLLGATLQRLYRCPACGRETESPIHSCGTATVAVRGVAWMTNDAVNVAATAVGALVSGGLSTLLRF